MPEKYYVSFGPDGRPTSIAASLQPGSDVRELCVPEEVLPVFADYQYDLESGIWTHNPMKTDEDLERSVQLNGLTQRLNSSDGVILEALESILSATTLTGLLSAVVSARTQFKNTLSERSSLREQIKQLQEDK